MDAPQGEIAKAFEVLTLERADASLEDLFKWMAFSPQKIAAWDAAGLDSLASRLKLGEDKDPSTIAQKLWSRLDTAQMAAVSAALKTGGATDVKRGAMIGRALSAPDALTALGEIRHIYFTQNKADVRKKFYDAKTHDIAKDWIDTHSLDILEADEADWVRYKLDGGIKHILLDEAQDTAPEQWDIINILAAPFFQPSPDDDPTRPRTLFAVGDEKHP